MFRINFSLVFGADAWHEAENSCRRAIERFPFLSTELSAGADENGTDEIEQDTVVLLGLKRLGFAKLTNCFLLWGNHKKSVWVSMDLHSLVSPLPVVALRLEKKIPAHITYLDSLGPSMLHFVFEKEMFICENRDWDRDSRLRLKEQEDGAEGLLENFLEVITLFSICMKRLCPDIYALAAFQKWIRIWPRAFRKINELDNSSDFRMQTGSHP